MEINYNITEEDYVNFNIYHNQNSKFMKRTILTMIIMIPVIFILLDYIRLKRITPVSVVISLILAVLAYLLKNKVLTFIVKTSVKQMMREGKINEFIGNHNVTLSDNTIRLKDKYQTQEFSYDAVQSIRYDFKGYLVVYVGTLSAILIPESAFKNKDEERNFTDYISERAGNL